MVMRVICPAVVRSPICCHAVVGVWLVALVCSVYGLQDSNQHGGFYVGTATGVQRIRWGPRQPAGQDVQVTRGTAERRHNQNQQNGTPHLDLKITGPRRGGSHNRQRVTTSERRRHQMVLEQKETDQPVRTEKTQIDLNLEDNAQIPKPEREELLVESREDSHTEATPEFVHEVKKPHKAETIGTKSNRTELPQKDAIPVFGPAVIGSKPKENVVSSSGIIENNIIGNNLPESSAQTKVRIKARKPSTVVTEPGLTTKTKNSTPSVTEPGLVPVTEPNKNATTVKQQSKKPIRDNKTEITIPKRKPSKKDKDREDNDVIRKCPYPCVCHENKVFCDKLMLKKVPLGAPRDTVHFDVKDNQIKRLQYGSLKGLSTLKHFLAKGNHIHTIQIKAFRDLHMLNSLSLTNNRLRRISPLVFAPLYSLQYMSLRMNKISKIEGLFTNNRELRLLNLGSNRIRRITEHTFKSNTLLRVLDLHNNSITHLHRNAFTWMPYLKYLVLRDNPLRSAEFNFKFNFHLELLDFTNCRLQEVMKGLPYSINDLRLAENNIKELKPEDFKNTKKIRLLVLNKNKISKIRDDTFANLTYLYDVYLSRNKLKKLPAFFPKSMNALYVNYNNLTHISPDAFNNSTKMEIMMFQGNQIQDVAQNAFKGLSQLKSLDLSYNKIKVVKPKTFVNMSRLEILDLSNNPIERLSHDCFFGLGNLNVLQMSSIDSNSRLQHNHLSPAAFKALHNLLFLDLSNSTAIVRHLAENPYVLNYLRSLEDLNLMHSALYGLPPDFPSHFPHLKVIKLVGNPWHCDRSILWLTKWMRNRDIEFFSRNNMICASPPEMKGKLIADIQEHELPTIPPPPKYEPELKPIDIAFKHVMHNKTIMLNLTEAQLRQLARNVANAFDGKLFTENYGTIYSGDLSTVPNAGLLELINATIYNETQFLANFTPKNLSRSESPYEEKRLTWFQKSEFRPFKKWIEPMPDNGRILNATRLKFIKERNTTNQTPIETTSKVPEETGSGVYSGDPEPTAGT